MVTGMDVVCRVETVDVGNGVLEVQGIVLFVDRGTHLWPES